MKETKINEIAELLPKAVIPAVRCKITKAYEVKSGEGDNGPWSVQNIVCRDDTGEIPTSVWNHDDLSPLIDTVVVLTAHEGKKGLSGVYAEDHTYNGKTTRRIKVTDTGIIKPWEEVKQNGASEETPKIPEGVADGGADETILHARKELMKVTNAMYVVEKAMMVQQEQAAVAGIPPNAESFGGKCSAAFRHLMSKGLVDKMPTKPLWSYAEQVKNDTP